ncbi:hypothetical protein Bealeia1_01555 [Candidatus Bealeia paramacronuclearis]|uniref:Uncharacterized protein n=1 Tax=Candidatus Bealeia paramacronuclearis TaxID=1921001 RepID=A0ABZ2C4L9_9PROT|nr:hypothetical protein [Candidatus Bealeia paramacronuclearis]
MKFLTFFTILLYGMLSGGIAQGNIIYMKPNEEITFTIPFLKHKRLSDIDVLSEHSDKLSITVERPDDGKSSIIIRAHALKIGDSRGVVAFTKNDPRRFWFKKFIISE